MRKKKPFLFLSCFFQAFCHSKEKLTLTSSAPVQGLFGENEGRGFLLVGAVLMLSSRALPGLHGSQCSGNGLLQKETILYSQPARKLGATSSNLPAQSLGSRGIYGKGEGRRETLLGG
jgi:hypothetical protein